MKTFAMTAIAATIVAGSAFAHPVNEPHVCGIDPDMVMDWPASNWVSEDGTIYDKGAYFFIATNDNDLSGEYTTTHTRIWKDDCRVVGTEIFHANDEPMMAAESEAWVNPGNWHVKYTKIGRREGFKVALNDKTTSGIDYDWTKRKHAAGFGKDMTREDGKAKVKELRNALKNATTQAEYDAAVQAAQSAVTDKREAR